MNSELNHKKQLAIAVHKGKIFELKELRLPMDKANLHEGTLANEVRVYVEARIKQLEKELKEIEDFAIVASE